MTVKHSSMISKRVNDIIIQIMKSCCWLNDNCSVLTPINAHYYSYYPVSELKMSSQLQQTALKFMNKRKEKSIARNSKIESCAMKNK